MSVVKTTVVGIDVGGERKGFHAVALRSGAFVATLSDRDPAVIVRWCRKQNATVVAVDAPCGWSVGGSSRMAERSLAIGAQKIHCFATPTRARAKQSRFYAWVFNGERLYNQLFKHYALFNGARRAGPACFETFPHAVVCALAGRVVLAHPKRETRRAALRKPGYEVSMLSNVDFVDAALCAVTAAAFAGGSYRLFGQTKEGFIVVPAG